MTSCCKNVCVPDACSLLFSAQVELKGKKIFEWLLEQYQVFICPEVKYECFQNIQRSRVEMYNPQRFKRDLSRKQAPNNIDYSKCLKYLEKFCNENGVPRFSKLGKGEKNAVALSLYLSVNLEKPIILLIDDFEAAETITPVLNEQKFAVQKSVPDFIIDLFKTNLSLNENQIRGTLQSYYNIMRNAVLHKTFKNRMKFSCRSFWIQECGLICK